MITLKEFQGKEESSVSTLFAKLFESRNFAHYVHLRTKSYAQHKALNSFYEDIVELSDSLYETYAGKYGQIRFDAGASVKEEDPIKYFENMGDMLSDAQDFFNEKDTHLINILDEIKALIYRTLYKLKFLK